MIYYLYGSKPGAERHLVATFDSEPQLLAYVNWATLKKDAEGRAKFEQGSVLSGFERWTEATSPLPNDDPDSVFHNPSPNML